MAGEGDESFNDDQLHPSVKKWLKSLADDESGGVWLQVLREIDQASFAGAHRGSLLFTKAVALLQGEFMEELADLLCEENAADNWIRLLNASFSRQEPPRLNTQALRELKLPEGAGAIKEIVKKLRTEKTSLALVFRDQCSKLTSDSEKVHHIDSPQQPVKPVTSPAKQKKYTGIAEAEIMKLCGLTGVKARVTSLVGDYTVGLKQGFQVPVGHFIFKGNPGTGKTTVANLFANLLFDMGIIPEEPMAEVAKLPPQPPAGAANDAIARLEKLQQGNEKTPLPTSELADVEKLVAAPSTPAKLHALKAKLQHVQEQFLRSPERLKAESILLRSIRSIDPSAVPPPMPKLYKTTGAKLASDGLKEAIQTFATYRHGCVFIDEAYQLLHDAEGRKILDLLLTEMEDHRKTLVVILAGYNRQIDDLLSTNPGFCSRVAPDNRLQFEDYGRAELEKILTDMVSGLTATHSSSGGNPSGAAPPQHHIDSDQTKNAVVNRLCAKANVEGFGNARDVRNMVECAVRRQRSRLAAAHGKIDDREFFILKDCDFLGECNPAPVECILAQLDKQVGIRAAKQKFLAIATTMLTDRIAEGKGQAVVDRIYHRCIVGKPGVGKTTLARCYAELLFKVGVCTNPVLVETTATELKSDHVGGSKERVLKRLEEADGGVLFIDEAYALGKANDPYFEEIVTTLVGRIQGKGSDRVVLLLAGYKEEMEKMLNTVNPGLKRRVQYADRFELDDFTEAEMHLLLRQRLAKSKVFMPRCVADAASAMIEKKKQMLNFGNAGEVESLATRILSRREARLFSGPDKDLHVLLEDVLDDLPSNTKNGAVAKLEDFVSLAAWRDRILRRLRNEKVRGLPSSIENIHFVFMGPPGTGKTTAARLVGKMLVDLGVLMDGKLLEKSVSELQTGYVGQAGLTTRKAMDEALGGVLFVDEAYRLVEDKHSFGLEILNELVSAVTEPKYKGKVSVVLAGYTANMQRLLASNVGLSRRFSEVVQFANFDGQRCAQLLRRRAGEDCGTIPWPLTASDKELADVFSELADGMGESFGNAGTVISVFERLKEEDGDWSGEVVRSAARSFLPQRVHWLEYQSCDQLPDAFSSMPITDAQNRNVSSVQQQTQEWQRVNQSIQKKESHTEEAKEARVAQPIIGAEDAEKFFSHMVKQYETESLRIASMSADSTGYKTNATTENDKQLKIAREKLALSIAANQLKDKIVQQRLEEERLAEEERRAEAAKEELKLREIQRQLEVSRQAAEETKRQLEAQKDALAAAMKAAQESQRMQTKLAQRGVCPMGYAWIDMGSRFQCAGGSHSVPKSDLI